MLFALTCILHTVVLTTIVIIQCFIYESGNQKVALPVVYICMGTIISAGVVAAVSIGSLQAHINYFFVFSYLSYLKGVFSVTVCI